MNPKAVDQVFCRNDTEILAEYSMISQITNLWIRQHQLQYPPMYVRELVWDYLIDGTIVPPTVQLNDTNAQQLIDMLWRCGFRPTEGRGSAGALTAVQEHLKDMRTIVSKQLKVEL